MQFREKAVVYEQCCFCGQSLDHSEVEKHAKVCLMSPMRCGRHLEGMNFEMFHGTSAANASAIEREGFRPSSGGMLGRVVYCSRDLRKARRYGEVVLRLSVCLGRVVTIDRQAIHCRKFGKQRLVVPLMLRGFPRIVVLFPLDWRRIASDHLLKSYCWAV